MTSQERVFKRQAHFTVEDGRGQYGSSVFKAELDDATIYVAAEDAGNPETGDGISLERSGSLVVARHNLETSINYLKLPESSEKDPQATKKVLTMLTFAMIQDEKRAGAWQDDEFTTLSPQLDQSAAELLDEVWKMRRITTGQQYGGRDESEVTRRRTRYVAGWMQAALRSTTMYSSPVPWSATETNGWTDVA